MFLPFVDGTPRLRKMRCLGQAYATEGWTRDLAQPASFLLSVRQAGQGEGCTCRSLLHSFPRLSRSIPESNPFHVHHQEGNLKVWSLNDLDPRLSPFQQQNIALRPLTTFCFCRSVPSIVCIMSAPMPLEFHDSTQQIFPPLEPVPSPPLPPSV